jgi:hypothetical protein
VTLRTAFMITGTGVHDPRMLEGSTRSRDAGGERPDAGRR